MSAEEINVLLNRRRALKQKLTRLENAVAALSHATARAILQVQLGHAEQIEVDVLKFEDDTLVTVPEDAFQAHADECTQLVNRCTVLKSTLLGLVQPTLRNASQDVGVATHDGTGIRSKSGVNLPKLETPKFDGSVHEWTSFRDRFTAAVGGKADDILSGSMKLEYLKAALSGDAGDLIRSIQITDANYLIAWDLLVKRLISRAHLDRLIAQEDVTLGCGHSLRALVDRTNECLRSLAVLGAPTDKWDILVCRLIERKLDTETRQQWELTFVDGSFPTLKFMLEFLDRRARSFEAVESAASMQPPKKKLKAGPSSTASCHLNTTKTCNICKGEHPVPKCPKLLASGPAERQDLIRRSGLCFNCLQPGHSFRRCNAGGCTKCDRKHNVLLHVEEDPKDKKRKLNSNHIYKSCTNRTVLLATAMIGIQDRFGQMNPVRALIDGGSQATFIKESCVQRLALQRKSGSMQVTGLGKTTVAVTKGRVELNIRSSFDPEFEMTAEAFILPEVTGYRPFVPGAHDWSHLATLPLADARFYTSNDIEILLGADVKSDILRAGIVSGPPGTPSGELTAFGWVLFGAIQHGDANSIVAHHVHLDLNSLVQRFWEIEEVSMKRVITAEEKMAEEHFVSTTTRDDTGKYVVRLPFRADKPPLGRSRDIAVRRLLQTERKLGWATERRDKYAAVINEYLELGHMELVPQNELVKPDNEVYYLPHHAVIKESSTTTKLRVVFNASAKTSTGISLNEKLLIGPTIQQDLFKILVRVRKHQIMFCADVCKMYRQVLVHEKDQDFQRILWRMQPTEPIREYRLKTVTFGYASSAFQAIRSMFQIAQDEEKDFPLAAKVIQRDFYVDDCISGANSLEEAIETQQQLLACLNRGGFPLRKWSSNSEEFLARLDKDMRETQLPLNIEADETIKTLGIQWNPATDCFGFKLGSLAGSTSVSKRAVLSEMSRVFDPLGWLAPVTVRAKMFFQSLWKMDLDWDQDLPDSALKLWNAYQHDLSQIVDFKVPRCLVIPNATKFELHGFSDASELGFAAALFLRSIDMAGQSWTRLVAAKTRVAPIKSVTLPRLELCGALLLSKLVDSVVEAMEIQFDVVLAYTDSTIVLYWLTESPHRWKKYVANRVSEIEDILPSTVWRHVGTKDNPADCPSRGVTAEHLKNCDLWWHGPKWLQDGTFPVNPNIPHRSDKIPEEKTLKIQAHVVTTTEMLDRFSSYTKLLRLTALCLRFAKSCRLGRANKITGWLTSNEIKNAEMTWVKVVQTSAYPQELLILKKAKTDENATTNLPTKSKIASLSPLLDDDGVIRVGGRLKHARIAFEMKHPAILPKFHRFTDLMLEYEHVKGLHAGSQLMLAIILQRFWVVGGRDAARRTVLKCVRCHRFAAPPVGQLMANLPETRVNPTRPFLNCGIDYAGPLMLKVMKGRGRKQASLYKGYVALFICFNTRAIHLELVSDLTSGACMAALERFVALRGLPESITSDQATNFKGVSNQLRQFIRLVNMKSHQNAMADFCAERQIQWKFNVPAAPHHGGLWEAGIKSFKHHLKRVVGHTVMSYEEATTVLTKISACLNSRPLTEVSTDPNDLAVLTPGHFLTGESLLAVPQPNFTGKSMNLLNRWQLLQRITQHFWQRWSKEYLTRLQQRPKWWTTSNNVKEGDLVLIRDDNLPPQKWKLGRIVTAHLSKDGKVRTVTLKSSDGIIDRSIVKISLLPFNRHDC